VVPVPVGAAGDETIAATAAATSRPYMISWIDLIRVKQTLVTEKRCWQRT